MKVTRETNGLVSASLRNTASNPIRFTLPARTHWMKDRYINQPRSFHPKSPVRAAL
jgi:hypothetical protein